MRYKNFYNLNKITILAFHNLVQLVISGRAVINLAAFFCLLNKKVYLCKSIIGGALIQHKKIYIKAQQCGTPLPIYWAFLFYRTMVKLREYQQELLDEILKEIPNTNKLCVQLSTGGGKTVIFTEMINQLNAKTLILVDSIDLVHQTN